LEQGDRAGQTCGPLGEYSPATRNTKGARHLTLRQVRVKKRSEHRKYPNKQKALRDKARDDTYQAGGYNHGSDLKTKEAKCAPPRGGLGIGLGLNKPHKLT
jgi:hypothetical protein